MDKKRKILLILLIIFGIFTDIREAVYLKNLVPEMMKKIVSMRLGLKELPPGFVEANEEIFKSTERNTVILLFLFVIIDILAYFRLFFLSLWAKRYFVLLYFVGFLGSFSYFFSDRSKLEIGYSFLFYSAGFILLMTKPLGGLFTQKSRFDRYLKFF